MSKDGEICLKNGDVMKIKDINSNYIPNKKEEIDLFIERDSINESVNIEIESLLKIRSIARNSKIYEISDRIRDLLKNYGVEIEDKENTTSWKKLN